MATLKFKTNINCTGCLSKVTPVLDQEKSIDKWEVDLNSDDKLLIIESAGITKGVIIQKINQAGYIAEVY